MSFLSKMMEWQHEKVLRLLGEMNVKRFHMQICCDTREHPSVSGRMNTKAHTSSGSSDILNQVLIFSRRAVRSSRFQKRSFRALRAHVLSKARLENKVMTFAGKCHL